MNEWQAGARLKMFILMNNKNIDKQTLRCPLCRYLEIWRHSLQNILNKGVRTCSSFTKTDQSWVYSMGYKEGKTSHSIQFCQIFSLYRV